MDQAFFTVDLAEKSLTAADFGAVLAVIRLLPVRQHIAQRCVGGEIQPPDFPVDLTDGAELAGEIDIRLDVDRFEAFRKLSGFGDAVVFFDMLA